MHKRDQRHQLPRSHKNRQKTVSRARQPGITVLLKNVYLMESMPGVYPRKQCQCVRKMGSSSKWGFICVLLYTVEIALGLLEVPSEKSSRKIMWNLVQALFINMDCVLWQWSECSWHGEDMAMWRTLTGRPLLLPTGCRGPCGGVPDWHPGKTVTREALVHDDGGADSVGFNAWLSL